ncbi:MAG TPA: Gfo/Idh/MocA family oxidoreductase [Burkholderiales bacterium]|nr:Gfo/Idh/MocA family oxidoreductase [Burkholderiales bacterium]
MTVRVGLIGAGVMGADHARILSTAVSGAELVAVSDLDAGRMGKIVEACRTARPFADPLDLVGDRGVDAVIVASPDQTHGALVLACLDSGKPVLCEKPLAASLEQCLKVIDKEKGLGRRRVTVGYMRRFDPGYVEMKQRLDEGELGAALIMHCIHRNVAAPAFMTGPMLITNSAVHEIDIARFVLGQEARRVSVVRPRKTGLSTMQDPLILLMEMDDGLVVDAEIFVNAQYGYDVRAELVCEKGTIALTPPHDVTVRHSSMEGFAFPSDWRPRFATAYRAELQAWTDALGCGVPTGASAWDGYVASAVADAGLKSLASGHPTEVELEPRPALYD